MVPRKQRFIISPSDTQTQLLESNLEAERQRIGYKISMSQFILSRLFPEDVDSNTWVEKKSTKRTSGKIIDIKNEGPRGESGGKIPEEFTEAHSYFMRNHATYPSWGRDEQLSFLVNNTDRT